MTRYTVILRHPDYIDDNTHAGTFQAHVEASSPEDAFGRAQDAVIAALYSPNDQELPDPKDWAVVAVFEGHLQDLLVD